MFVQSSILVAAALLAVSQSVATTVVKRQSSEAFVSPLDGGGSLLSDAGNGLGEPLNVIISGLSSADVLTDDGFLNYVQSLGFSFECLDLHLGNPQSANLGDGNGQVNQTVEYREDYGDALLGTCLESLIGGDHLRMWRQNGADANTGALFLAVSQEENLEESHTIAPDGYDVGRDELVGNATAGTTTFGGVSYTATEEDITGLLPTGTAGVNHDIAIDGIVKLLTVTIV